MSTNTDQARGASEGVDFISVSKVIEFSSGEEIVTCPINIVNDVTIEKEESFLVIISNDNVQIDHLRNQSVITIFDDDGRYTKEAYFK